jgi:serine/threonine-protein kinase
MAAWKAVGYRENVTAQALRDPFGLVGTTLDGEHRVDAIVGEGGFGVVYRGWHLGLEQPIAIKALKVLADDRAVQDALLAKFRDEAKLLYTLSQTSLNIVRSIDFGAVTAPTGHWAPFMVLEWLEGRSLAEDLDQRRRRRAGGRSLEEAIALLSTAAEGLSVAHQRKVVHRDVKPGNFFLLAGAEPPRLKVLDFGIAKILREGEQGGTKSPFASFTWLYAAPEQLDPRVGQTSLATDVYSFALVLSEVLTDRPPADAHDVVGLLKAATDPTIRPTPRQRGAQVPDGIEVACRRALAVDPRARFASIGELWAAITAAARPAPAEIGRTSVGGAPGTARAVTPEAGVRDASLADPTARRAPPSHERARPGSSPQITAGLPPAVRHVHTPPGPMSPPLVTPPPMAAPFASPIVPYGPGPVGPPPGTQRRQPVPSPGPSASVVLAIVAIVLGLMFAATCGVLHAAC